MAFETDKRVFAGTAQQAAIDEGLRAYMLKVYNYMTIGLVVTGFVALLTASSPTAMNAIYGTPLRWLVMLAPLGFIIFLSFGLHRMSFLAAQAVFWAFCTAMGVSLSYIFMVYTGGSIARVFFITAGAFAGLSLFGYTTKKDLSGFGTFLIMGLIGIIIASIVNIFLASSALHFAISVIGVLVFSGLTAYDTQNIKNEYSEYHDRETAGKLAISGALRLYLDFINLFIMLLSLFGNRD
jgi:FtsH-binding integral membrane protein